MITRAARAAARRLPLQRPRPVILMYHRVIDTESDPWGLAISPARFRRQVNFLARRRSVLALPHFVDALAGGRLPRDAVAITFDDGYVDNLLNAEPILATAGLPATLFVVSGMVGRPEPFWWDELSALVLDREQPLDCHIALADGRHRVQLPAREAADDGKGWRTWHAPRSARQAAYVSLWTALRRLPPEHRAAALDGLRRAAPGDGGQAAGRAMTGQELRRLASRGTFAIGAHTVSHPVLPTLDSKARRHEVEQGKADLQRLLGGEIQGFAYPFGEVDDATRDCVESASFEWACSIRPIADRAPSDPFGLPRVAAPSGGAAALAGAMAAAPDLSRPA
jgi:peptidoglycan/xylan/chitin deacetylase (PgdA/CDA1 family)